MVSVQEGHFSVRLYPHLPTVSMPLGKGGTARLEYLVFCVLGKIVQSSYVQLELSRLRELAKACSQADEIWLRDRDGETH